MRNRDTVSALHFRQAIRSAVDACDCTLESLAQQCGVSRQTISYMLAGRYKMRRGTARAVADALIAELSAEVTAEHERINMLEQIAADVNNAYNREYAEEG